MALLAVLSLTGCGYGSKLDASAACDAWQAKGKQIKIVREYTKDGRFKVQSIDQVSVRKCIAVSYKHLRDHETVIDRV